MIIAVDFDGTLCTHMFPEIGMVYQHVLDHVIKLRSDGHKLILWTCRDGIYLQDAVNWCEVRGLKFDAVNDNLPENKDKGFASRKIYADIYLDDRNVHPNEIKVRE